MAVEKSNYWSLWIFPKHLSKVIIFDTKQISDVKLLCRTNLRKGTPPLNTPIEYFTLVAQAKLSMQVDSQSYSYLIYLVDVFVNHFDRGT